MEVAINSGGESVTRSMPRSGWDVRTGVQFSAKRTFRGDKMGVPQNSQILLIVSCIDR